MTYPVEISSGTALPHGLAIDIDGTLLRKDHTLSEAVRSSIQAIEQSGSPVILVSGRPPRSVLAIARELQISGPMVALNGSLALATDGQIIHTHHIRQSIFAKLTQMIDQHKTLTAHYFNERDWLTPRNNQNVRIEARILGFPPTMFPDPSLIRNINKIMVVGNVKTLKTLAEEISEQDWPVTVDLSKPTYLEITDMGVTKATGLQYAADEYGLTTRNFTAFGDGDNDIPLFKACGYGVAMGNASERLMNEADTIIGTNDQDALATYINSVLLNNLCFDDWNIPISSGY